MIKKNIIRIIIIIGFLIGIVGLFCIDYVDNTFRIIIRIWVISFFILAFCYYLVDWRKKKRIREKGSTEQLDNGQSEKFKKAISDKLEITSEQDLTNKDKS